MLHNTILFRHNFIYCGKQESAAETTGTIENTAKETIETTATDIETDDFTAELLPWAPLASLDTYPELCEAFEELLGISTNEDGNKLGIVYTDDNGEVNQNNTLFNALGNTNFMIHTIRDADQIKTIEEIAHNEYTDILENQEIPAVINAYFNLLPDQAEGVFDGSSSLTRAQAMTLVMRATTPVNEAQAPEANPDFTAAVGDNQYTDYAARLADAFKEDDRLAEDVTLTILKDGGNLSFLEALDNPDNGLPTEMCNTLARAIALGFIKENEIHWEEAITKSEAISLFIDASDFFFANSEFITTSQGNHIEKPNAEGLTIEEAIQADNEWFCTIPNIIATFSNTKETTTT